ncbi:signal peptidase I [Streptococcus equi subsp. zooepidemicus Sz12is]|nr:signal peptidase I [Streptococcus equi subsp. zooepidemicus Sz12is]
MTKKQQEIKGKKVRPEVYQLIRQILLKSVIVGGFIYIFITFVIGVSFIKNEYMAPSLKVGDLSFYFRIFDSIKIDDVVVYQEDNFERIGRVVAQSGDRLEITDEGELLINGHARQEKLAYPTYPHSSGITYPYVVPKDSYFVIYDYRDEQGDSRFLGAISKEKIKGVITTLIRVRGV